MKKVLLVFVVLLLVFASEACGQAYEAMRGTSVDTFSIGNRWWFELFRDHDSSWVKLRMKIENKDSILVLVDTTKLKRTIQFETTARETADGNLLAHILLKADLVDVDSIENKLNYAVAQINLKAGKNEVDGLRDSLWVELNLKATVASLDSIKNRMLFAEGEISNKAGITEVAGLRDSVWAEIYLRARSVTVDSVKNRMSVAEAGITAHASQILGLEGDVTDLTSSLFLYALRDSLISYINISPEQITISANKISLDGDVVATSLTSKTIIAPVIRTSASGAGVVLNGATNRLEFLKTDGTVGSYLDANGGNIHLGGTVSNDGTITGGVIQTSTSAVNQIKIFHDGTAGRIRFSNSSGLTIGDIIGYTDLSNHDWIQILSDVKTYNLETSGYVLASGNIATLGDFYMNGNLVATQTWVNGRGFLTGFTETDPTIYNWAKQSTKPSYSWSEISSKPFTTIGAGLIVEAGELINDYTEGDPTVPAWAKVATPPYLTAETDPNVGSHIKAITSQNITDWNWASAVVNSLHTVAVSGSYNDLINKPTLFDGTWNSLTGKPSTFTPASHTHSPAYIDTDLNNRFVTDAQIASWNAKQNAITGVTTYIEVYDELSSSVIGLTFTNGILTNVQ